MNNTTHTLIFAALLATICSALLVGANMFTAPYRKANEEAEQIRNYLVSMGATVTEDMKAGELISIFNSSVTKKTLNGLELMEYRSGGTGEVSTFAVPFRGAGVWAPIEGVLALEADMQTIAGIRFFKQEETPGLGGEIASEWFQTQFTGKKIVDDSGKAGLFVRKPGMARAANEVDGITGATMTSDKVTEILNPIAGKLQEK